MRLTGDRVLVRPVPRGHMTDSGLFIPDAYQYESETAGMVVALGTGPRAEDGTVLEHEVSVGDIVFFSPHVGQETDAFGERMFILREEDILAVQEPEFYSNRDLGDENGR